MVCESFGHRFDRVEFILLCTYAHVFNTRYWDSNYIRILSVLLLAAADALAGQSECDGCSIYSTNSLLVCGETSNLVQVGFTFHASNVLFSLVASALSTILHLNIAQFSKCQTECNKYLECKTLRISIAAEVINKNKGINQPNERRRTILSSPDVAICGFACEVVVWPLRYWLRRASLSVFLGIAATNSI